MNIICNSCVGGRLYEKLNKQFNNPFMWVRLSIDDFIYVIKNFDNINFKNVKFSLEQYNKKAGTNVLCTLENDLKLHYTHYLQDNNYKTPTTVGINVLSNNAVKYTEEKYFSRLSRMNNKPTFLCSMSKLNISDKKYYEYIKELMNIDTSYEIYIISYLSKKKFNTKKKNIHFIYLEDEYLNASTETIAFHIRKYFE